MKPSIRLRGRKVKPTVKCRKLKLLKWPLEADSKSKESPKEACVKTHNFPTQIIIFTVLPNVGRVTIVTAVHCLGCGFPCMSSGCLG